MAGDVTHRDQTDAWSELHRQLGATARRRRRGGRAPRARDVVLPVIALLAVTVPVAIAAPDGAGRDDPQVVAASGEGEPLELGRRNPGSGASNRETAVVANVAGGGLVLRPSNTAKGGRAISATCDNDGLAAEDGCAVYVNKGQGAAASFRTAGSVPFALRDTNNGRVAHLNADRVDDLHASEIVAQAVGQARAKPGLDADSVDGFSAESLVRSAFASTDGPALDGVAGAAATTNIQAPTNGFLFINAGADGLTNTSSDFVRCDFEVNDAMVPGSEREIRLDGNENPNAPCQSQGVATVSAGSYKVDFEIRSVAPESTFDEATLQVIFIPFGAGGAQP
jgi:hypothetical protein